ncbi:MAG: hypothetical protein B6D56_02950 [Candidatus Omnitrophica bacterium 4484_70.1]|nr:MAG: hypothetical protein B6D56_02950 [Candidatus Omnitrophica bacterium 4484_70.1]
MIYTRIRGRTFYVFIFFFIFFFLILLRIGYLQLFYSSFLKKLAKSQRYSLIRIEGERGKIYDCQGRILATDINTFSIYADPKLIKDKKKYSLLLSSALDISASLIEKRLNQNRRFVWIKRKVSLEEEEKIERLKLKGIGWVREKKRVYPQGSLAAHILGGVNIDNHGIEGIELFYDTYLRGKKGIMQVWRDSSSILLSSPFVIYPQKGADLVLTVDAQIQYWVEKYLEETVNYFNAKRGAVVVINPYNGEILALANFPSFDPNFLSKTSQKSLRNYAISSIFEPGSVFKIVTLVACIAKKIDEKINTIFCEGGSFKIPGTTLHDYRAYNNLTFEEVFKKSSNIGVAKLANLLGEEVLWEYIQKLGFGKKTGIDLPGEEKGLVKPVTSWSRTSSFIVPIGQEIGVTLIQLAKAMSIIVNGGFDIQPHLVKKIISTSFIWEKKYRKKMVLSPWVAEEAKRILVQVVEEGTGRKAKIKNVKVGGKTGTAQRFNIQLGRYTPYSYQASFVGFLENKRFSLVIGVTIEEPKKSHLGGVVAAPLFKKIAEKILAYKLLQLELAKQ